MNKIFMEKIIEVANAVKCDIPVAALIAKDNEIVALCQNEKEDKKNSLYHAEMLAIDKASKALGRWRLDDCDLYVTLEPCPMCAWAVIQARIKNVYFGAFDNLYGAFGSKVDLRKLTNSKLNVKGGICEEECNKILDNYFKKMRNEQK